MAYTVYRNVQVLAVQQQKVERSIRPQEIADPARRRDDHMVTVARFSNVAYEVALGDFKQDIQTGQNVTVAVDDKWQLIALANHSTGKEAGISYASLKLNDIFGILFYMAIPGVLFFFIGRKAFTTVKYHDAAWYIWLAGLIVIFAIFRGVNADIAQSRKALAELKSK